MYQLASANQGNYIVISNGNSTLTLTTKRISTDGWNQITFVTDWDIDA